MKKFESNQVNMNEKRESGITLVALVVTIIVIIILATVSINAVFSDNGIIKKAQLAKNMQANSIIAEEEGMNRLLEEYNNMMAEPLVDPTAEWDLGKVDKITSEDNKVVPVPKGYTASTIEGEKRVDTGFVIKEGDNGTAKSGINEFVWVPVDDITDLYDSTNDAGQLWRFEGKRGPLYPAEKVAYDDSNNEPNVVTKLGWYDANSANLQQAGLPATATATDFKNQLQKEFKDMKDSVEKYGGFYIGRYETGNLSQDKAVVQKGNTDIGNQTWYTQYKVSKTIATNGNVASSIIWGCQWDATLRWMQNHGTTDKVIDFPAYSEAYGNYLYNAISYVDIDGIIKKTTVGTKTRIPTGSAEITNINNIYDMAGNVADWTMEAYYNDRRMARGSDCEHNGENSPSSTRRENSTFNMEPAVRLPDRPDISGEPEPARRHE